MPSCAAEGFEYSSDQRKRQRKKNNKKVVTGTSREQSGNLKGAPEPSREVFVYRVVKGTEENDIQEYLEEKNIAIRGVQKVSKEEAKFVSFRVEIKVSDMKKVLDSDFWPEGIHVRRFFKPRSNTTEESWS